MESNTIYHGKSVGYILVHYRAGFRLKTSPSYLDSDLDLKSNLDSSLKPNLNSNSCGLALTNSLNIFSIFLATLVPILY